MIKITAKKTIRRETSKFIVKAEILIKDVKFIPKELRSEKTILNSSFGQWWGDTTDEGVTGHKLYSFNTLQEALGFYNSEFLEDILWDISKIYRENQFTDAKLASMKKELTMNLH